MSSAGTSGAGTADTGTAGAGAGAGTGTGTTPPWYEGADQETVGYLQNRGWDKVDAKTAALNAAKAHREAEKLIGVPADKVIRLPKDANDAEGWNNLRAKLDVPADAKGYDFSQVKFADGTELGEDFTTALGTALSKSNVSKNSAPEIAQSIIKFMESAEAADTATTEATLATQKDALKQNWGNNFNANMLVAQNAFRALSEASGVENVQAATQALEKVIGYDKTMEFFRNIGTRIGEDTFVRSTAPGQTGVMTKEQAKATLTERMADSIWANKLMAGDSNTVREFDTLTRLST